MGPSDDRDAVTIFLCGDVMTGRGVDQILPHPGDPTLREPSLQDARDYVALARTANGPFRVPVRFDEVWGDALRTIAARAPAARVINLETAVTTRSDFWPGKEIHYRMHPGNVGVLAAAGVDVCVLANNHVLDFGIGGLEETLEVLRRAGQRTAGAGRTEGEAFAPATVALGGGSRLHVFGVGDGSSGIPATWSATANRPGVARLPDLADTTADALAARVRTVRRQGDLALVSIHWGSNWGYEIPASHRRFARRLIEGGVDLIHGHSSHHPRTFEVYRDRLILYGCGDFLNDYEGIGGFESYRGDLVLAWFPTLDRRSGALLSLETEAFRLHHLRPIRASPADQRWLHERLPALASFAQPLPAP